MAQRIRRDVTYGMYNNMGDALKTQLDLLWRSSLDKFKADQRGVKITVNVANVIKGLVDDSIVAFKSVTKILRSKELSRSGSKSKSLLLSSSSFSSMGGGGRSGSRNGAANLGQSYGGTALDLRRELDKSVDCLLTMAQASIKLQPLP